MKHTVSVLLLLMIMVLNLQAANQASKYGETKEFYHLKGPVKSCLLSSKNDKVYLEFNKDGFLTKGITTRKSDTLSTFVAKFDKKGNVIRRTHCDYSIKCLDCEKEIKEREPQLSKEEVLIYDIKSSDDTDSDCYTMCKNNPEFVRNRVKSNLEYVYNNKNELVKVVQTEVENNYDSIVTLYQYDEKGHKIRESHHYASGGSFVDKWEYENDLLVKDNNFYYKYNDKQQLVEKQNIEKEERKIIYTYYPNGKLKSRVSNFHRDSLVYNINGDTMLCVQNRMIRYSFPGVGPRGIVVGMVRRQVVEYDKENIRTKSQFYNEQKNLVFENFYDEKGNCIKSVFKKGYVDRAFNKEGKVLTDRLYLDNALVKHSEYDDKGVCVKEEYYEAGVLRRMLTRETDKYGNVVKENEALYFRPSGGTNARTTSSTIDITYY